MSDISLCLRRSVSGDVGASTLEFRDDDVVYVVFLDKRLTTCRVEKCRWEVYPEPRRRHFLCLSSVINYNGSFILYVSPR